MKVRIKISFNLDLLREDLRKMGLTCLAAGSAGMFLDLYPGHSSKAFFGMIMIFGGLTWLVGLIERR